jgi:hypothetical protein
MAPWEWIRTHVAPVGAFEATNDRLWAPVLRARRSPAASPGSKRARRPMPPITPFVGPLWELKTRPKSYVAVRVAPVQAAARTPVAVRLVADDA